MATVALAFQSAAQAQEMRAAYDLHRMVAQGRVKGNNAELTIDFLADNLTDKPARIPLRLDEGIITGKKFGGDDAQSLTLKDAGKPGGYAWHLPPEAKNCRLTLTVLVPLKVVAGEDQLVFTAPQEKQAESVLNLSVPGDVELGEVLGGEHPTDPVKQPDRTEFTFRRLSGQFTCSWHPRDKLIREARKLRARLFIHSRYEATDRQFRSDVRVTVMSFGGKFRETRLRLPPGASLVKSNPRWAAVEESPEKGHLVTMRHEPLTRHSFSLELVHPFDTATRQPVQLAAFKVLGTMRQWGYLALEYDDRSQVRWGSLNETHVGRIAVADLPKEFSEQLNLVSDDVRAAFELFSDRASLPVRGFRSSPRIRIEPEYVVLVHRDRLRLDATFRLTVDRAPASQFKIDLPAGEDWQVERIGPESIVGPYVVEPPVGIPKAKSVKRTVTIDLKNNMTGSFTIQLSAERRFEGEVNSLYFRVPQPIGGRAVNPRLWVQAANEVLLQPPDDLPASLIRQPPPTKAPAAIAGMEEPFRQPPLFYRVNSPAARFAAGLTRPGRQLSVRANGTVTVGPDGAPVSVEQRFEYVLEHEPLRELALRLPEAISDPTELTYYLNDELLENPEFVDQADEDAKTEKTAPNVRRLKLGDAVMPGKFTLRIEHKHPRSGPSLAVPLVMPAEGDLAASTLRVEAQGEVSVRLADPSVESKRTWIANGSGPATSGGFLEVKSDQHATSIVLEFGRVAPFAEEKLVMEQLWVQTWLLADRRVDRWICRFSGGGPMLRLEMPKEMGGFEVLLDGKRLTLTPEEHPKHNTLAVPLQTARGAKSRQRLLQVSFQMPAVRNLTASLAVARPPKEAWVRRAYWQLVLPEDQHLVSSPGNLTREFAWRWQGAYWVRRSTADHHELARKFQIEDLDAPPADANRYLFSTLGPLPPLRVAVAGRTSLLLGASGIVFAVGLLLLNVPALRRGWLLAAAALLLLVSGLIFPATAIVAAQAASLGLAAVLLMAGLKWLLTTARPIPLRLGGNSAVSASAILEAGSTQARSAQPRSANGSRSMGPAESEEAESVAPAGGDSAS